MKSMKDLVDADTIQAQVEALLRPLVEELCNVSVTVDHTQIRVIALVPSMYGPHAYATFTLCDFPGCCGMVVSTGAYVSHSARNKGIGTALHNYRKELARDMGYTVLVCTDVTTNEPQRSILKASGFTDAFSFVNKRTGNPVAMSYIEL